MSAPETNSQANAGQIIFVTGASRSGTTLVCRILGNHHNILGLKELHFFGDLKEINHCQEPVGDHELNKLSAMLLARQARDFWVDGPNSQEQDAAQDILSHLSAENHNGAGIYAATVAFLARASGKSMACEQTPRNIFYAQQLLDLYPEARVVHIIRDPRAVLASQKNRWHLRKLGGKNVPFSEIVRLWFNYHPVTMTKLWLAATEAALSLAEHPRFTLLRFEDLAEAPEENIGQLCSWLGIEFEPVMLEVPQWGSSNIEHQSNSKGVSSAMVSKWKDVLSAGEISISERLTDKYLDQFKYERVGSGSLSLSVLLLLMVRYPVHILGAIVINPRRVMIQLRALLRARG